MLLLTLACLPWRTTTDRVERSPDQLNAVLINGGGYAEGNYSSHLAHLQETREVLIARGFDPSNVTVFDADGGSPEPDQAYSWGEIEGEWYLIGTTYEDLVLEYPLRDSRWEVERRPATTEALTHWFQQEQSLKEGDLLFFYVTDHGTPGSLSLWNEDLSPWQLAQLLDEVPERTRVVLAMNQCFAGQFLDALDPSREQCGLFAVPADRKSNGCYPIEDGSRVGHAFELAEALTWATSLDRAYDAVSLADDAPDVPMLSSDLLLARALPPGALQGLDLSQRSPDLSRFHALQDRFGLQPLVEPGALSKEAAQLEGLAERATEDMLAWMDLLADANRLLERNADLPEVDWVDGGRESVELLADAMAEQARSEGHETIVQELVERLEASLNTYLARSTMAAVRLRQLVELRRLVVDRLDVEDRDRYEALRGCEGETLGVAPTAEPPALSPLSWSDQPLTPPDEGVSLDADIVTRVQRGAGAWGLGLREGDRIRAVDGESSLDWFPIALALGADTIVVQREGGTLELSR